MIKNLKIKLIDNLILGYNRKLINYNNKKLEHETSNNYDYGKYDIDLEMYKNLICDLEIKIKILNQVRRDIKLNI